MQIQIVQIACSCHLLDSRHRLERANQQASGFSIRKAGNIQAVVDAIDEIHIGMAGWPKENAVARGASGGSMRSQIVYAKVGFNFHNSPGEQLAALPADNQFPQQLRTNLTRITIEKRSPKQFLF